MTNKLKCVLNAAILSMLSLNFARCTSEAAVAKNAELEPVGLQKQLLVDDYVVAEKHKNPWCNPRLQFNWLTNWIYEGVYFAPMNVYAVDVFVCLEAEDEPGTIVTKAFKLEGRSSFQTEPNKGTLSGANKPADY
jgi:hypothetical protein